MKINDPVIFVDEKEIPHTALISSIFKNGTVNLGYYIEHESGSWFRKIFNAKKDGRCYKR